MTSSHCNISFAWNIRLVVILLECISFEGSNVNNMENTDGHVKESIIKEYFLAGFSYTEIPFNVPWGWTFAETTSQKP